MHVSAALELIKDKCIRGKRAELAEAVKSALAEGVDAKDIMVLGLIPAMAVVGEKYGSGEFFLPQMMIAARAMSEALEFLNVHGPIFKNGFRDGGFSRNGAHEGRPLGLHVRWKTRITAGAN